MHRVNYAGEETFGGHSLERLGCINGGRWLPDVEVAEGTKERLLKRTLITEAPSIA